MSNLISKHFIFFLFFFFFQAKKFVESAPQPVKTDISKEAAEQLKNALEAVGAEIVIE